MDSNTTILYCKKISKIRFLDLPSCAKKELDEIILELSVILTQPDMQQRIPARSLKASF